MLPYMTNVKAYEKTIKNFKGLNYTQDTAEGELTESVNLSSKHFPSLSPRSKRSVVSQTNHIINGLSTFAGYIYTSYCPETQKLFLNFDNSEYEFTEFTSSPIEDTRKFAALSDCILIIPDNIIFYVNSRTFASVCISQITSASSTRKKFDIESNGSDVLDNAQIRYVASFNHNSISFVETAYTQNGNRKFFYGNFDSSLKQGDIVNLKMTVFSDSAPDDADYNEYVKKMKDGISVKVKDVVKVTHTVYTGEQTETVKLIFDDNTINTGGYKNLRISKLTLQRGMPAVESICSHHNRIWAISGNDIFTSKLGDPSEWNDFSTDIHGILPNACFSTKAETDGDFTAITSFNNYIFAFKQNAIHKVYGDSPAEYTLYTKLCQGTPNNSNGCVCVGENSIIYPSSDGIYIYSDDYPICVSEKIENCISPIDACSDSRYYYVLSHHKSGKNLYVYDLKRKIWHTQDAPDDALFLTSYGTDVYMATKNSIIHFDNTDSTENVKWNFTMRFDERFFDKRTFTSLGIRYSLAKNSSFTVRARFDDSTKGALCGAVYDENQGGGCVIQLPIKRCLWFELEFSGIGDFLLKGLKLKFYSGSEI